LSGPSYIRQIHCSGIWEELVISASATLTDGVSNTVLPSYQLPAPFVMHGIGRFHADWSGSGQIRSFFGTSTASLTVSAINVNFYITGVSMDFVPAEWNAPLNQRIPITPVLSPSQAAAPWQNPWNLTNLTVKFSSSTVSAVKVDANNLVLTGDYYQAITITAQTVQCDNFSPQSYTTTVIVNVMPTNNADIDIGNAAGLPIPLVAVDQIMTIPVFINALVRLKVRIHDFSHINPIFY